MYYVAVVYVDTIFHLIRKKLCRNKFFFQRLEEILFIALGYNICSCFNILLANDDEVSFFKIFTFI